MGGGPLPIVDRIIDQDGVEWIRVWEWLEGEHWVSVAWHGARKSPWGGYTKGELMDPEGR